MHFQVRTDNHIENSEDLTDRIRDEVEGALSPRFTDRVRRVEVYLQDMNGHKKGVDTRCSIEVSLAGHQPVAVDDRATSIDDAVRGASGQGGARPRPHDRPHQRPRRTGFHVGRRDLT